MSELIEGTEIKKHIAMVRAGVLFDDRDMMVLGDANGQVIIIEKMPVQKVKDNAPGVRVIDGTVTRMVELVLKSGLMGYCNKIWVGFYYKGSQWFIGKVRNNEKLN